MTRRVFATQEGAQVLLFLQPILLLCLILLGSLPPATVNAFPASAISGRSENNATAAAINNETFSLLGVGTTPSSTGILTEYPVFISDEGEYETQTIPTNNSEPDVATETFMVIEEQEVDEDEHQDYFGQETTTESSAILRSTQPMRSPKSSPEQEEVLHELRKLRELSEGLDNDVALKSSLSSIVHLAYARVYIEPDETLFKLKYLLRALQARILGTGEKERNNSDNHHHIENGNVSTTEITPGLPSSSSSTSSSFSTSAESKYYYYGTATPTSSPKNLMTATTLSTAPNNETKYDEGKKRKKRSFYDNFEEIENIFFANVNSEENSVIPDEKNHYQSVNENNKNKLSQFVELNTINEMNHDVVEPEPVKNLTIVNAVVVDPLDRAILSTYSSSSTITSIVTQTPPPATTAPSRATMVQKVIHINDRRKPASSFYLSPERVKELKRKMTSTTTPMSPIGLIIDDELENEVNSLQQHDNIENFDVQISEEISHWTTTEPTLIFKATATEQAKPLIKTESTTPTTTTSSSTPSTTALTTTTEESSTTESPFTAEEIALALFQLLKPEASHESSEDSSAEDESVTPHPTPSDILYQVGSLSSALYPKNDSASITTPPPVKTKPTFPKVIKVNKSKLKNATLLALPSAFSNLGSVSDPTTSRSTAGESQNKPYADYYDYGDVPDKPAVVPPNSVLDVAKDSLQHMIDSVANLSVGAKLVLLFCVAISVLSIGFGLYTMGPPLAGIGILGIIIPVALLLLFETSASQPTMAPPMGKKRKLAKEKLELLMKLQSEELAKVMDLIFQGVAKYSDG